MSVGQRGKAAEKIVQKYLEHINETHAKFDFERLSDARSGGGMGAKRVVGDFSFFAPGVHGVIEVKSIKHDFRLPAKNVSQLPKLRKRTLAGGRCFILVFHTETRLWRCLLADDLEIKSTGSWDLSVYPAYPSLELALPLQALIH